jgi:CRP-like cAMP-binding protein
MAAPLTLGYIVSFLLDTPMFGDLDESELSQIVHIMQLQHLRPGQVLFREGSPGEAWYVLYEGNVDVLLGADGDERVIASLGARSCFGEMAVLDGSPRSATVRAADEATVFRFPRTAFHDLLRQGNLAAYKLVFEMAKVLAARQRATTRTLSSVIGHAEAAPVQHRIAPIVEASSLTE